MAPLAKMDLLDQWVKLDLPDLPGHLAEGDQELQVYRELMEHQEELGLRDQQEQRVLQDFPGHQVLTDPQVSRVHSPRAVAIFCAPPSVLLVHLGLQECQGSRVTRVTKETRGSLAKMERRVMQAPLALQVFQEQWVFRVPEV